MAKTKQERFYQAGLIKTLRQEFDGCFILKNDSSYLQGVPDLLLLWRDRWAILEVKAEKPTASDFEPNQEYYLEQLNGMSFAACIYPANQDEVIDAIQQAFRLRRTSRRS